MNFLFPLFIAASLVIGIPILIHLFNFRKYKKVLFPDIRFLKELQEQTQKSSRLKHLLILASRILAVLSLVFAFAQPFFSKDKEKITQGPKAVSIYVDNSFSMGVEKNAISLVDLAKGKAKEIIETYSSSDQFQILTNDFAYNENRFLTKGEALRFLSTIQVSATTRNAEIILEKQKQLLQTEHGFKKQIVFISDFQKNNFKPNLTIDDSTQKFFVRVNANAINNISLDTLYFESPTILLNEPNNIVVKLKNNSNEEANTSLTLMDNNQLKSVVNVSLKGNELKTENISFTTSKAGYQNIKVFIQDNPIRFDDTFFVAGKVSSNFSVLVLNQNNANAFLNSVFKPNTQFRMDNNNVTSFNASLLSNYSLVVLNSVTALSEPLSNALLNFAQKGGSILVFAPQNNSTNGINTFLTKTAGCNFSNYDTNKLFVTSYNKTHSIFKDIFVKTPENIEFPIVYKHFIISKAALSSEQKLFTFSNGDAFLSSYKIGAGTMYVCGSSAEISASNFPKSYWFLPIIYKMAFMNANNSINALTLGKNASFTIENNKVSDKTIYHVAGNGVDAIPEQRSIGSKIQLNINQGIKEAGLYSVYLEGSKDSNFVGINYNRAESIMDFWTMKELKNNSTIKNAEWLEDNINASSTVNELQHGIPLWKVCILLALLFLLIEILLIRLMK